MVATNATRSEEIDVDAAFVFQPQTVSRDIFIHDDEDPAVFHERAKALLGHTRVDGANEPDTQALMNTFANRLHNMLISGPSGSAAGDDTPHSRASPGPLLATWGEGDRVSADASIRDLRAFLVSKPGGIALTNALAELLPGVHGLRVRESKGYDEGDEYGPDLDGVFDFYHTTGDAHDDVAWKRAVCHVYIVQSKQDYGLWMSRVQNADGHPLMVPVLANVITSNSIF